MERSNRRVAAAVSALAFALASGTTGAAYVFNSIDYPGAQTVRTFGINNTGQIAVSTDIGSFVYKDGGFFDLPAPPPGWTVAPLGINDAGDITGYAYDSESKLSGFVLRAGTYRIFDRPPWPNTGARAIGNSGLVTGHSYNDDWFTQPSSAGWIYDPQSGAFTDIVPPGNLGLITAQGINAAGQVVGSYSQGTGNASAFLREPDGTLHTFQLGGRSTAARGINDNGLIVGWVVTASGELHAYVGNSNGFEELQCPESACPRVVSTAGQGINNDGQIVGEWEDDAGRVHGFIATPAALPAGTTVDGAYVFDVAVVPNQTIYIDPAVSLGFDYEIGAGDPKFASVKLPIGIGDNRYTLIVNGRQFALNAGETFEFLAHGFGKGVAQFRVVGIEESAGLDPANAAAFPTGLTFVAAGRFTGTMTPLCRTKPLPANANGGNGRGLAPCSQ